jgi:hypothetical protein
MNAQNKEKMAERITLIALDLFNKAEKSGLEIDETLGATLARLAWLEACRTIK